MELVRLRRENIELKKRVAELEDEFWKSHAKDLLMLEQQRTEMRPLFSEHSDL